MKELTRVICPECNSVDYKKNGYYSCKNGDLVAKYFCKMCETHFSAQNAAPDKHAHRNDINDEIIEYYEMGYSRRAIAKEVGCSRKTVDLKIKKYLSSF